MSSSGSSVPPRRCHCGKLAVEYFSWEPTTFDRRFWGCPDFRPSAGKRVCDYIDWIDLEHSPRAAKALQFLATLLAEERHEINELKISLKAAKVVCAKHVAELGEARKSLQMKAEQLKHMERIRAIDMHEIERLEVRVRELTDY